MRQPSSKEDTQSLLFGGISSDRHIAHAHKRLLVWAGLLMSARASWLAAVYVTIDSRYLTGYVP